MTQPYGKYVLLYEEDLALVERGLQALSAISSDREDDPVVKRIERIRQHMAWTPPENHYKFVVGLQMSIIEEGEDAEGYYEANEAPIPAQVAMDKVIDELGRTETGMGFEAVVKDAEDKAQVVKFEWNGAFFLEPRWEV